jgi:hypothetical protein
MLEFNLIGGGITIEHADYGPMSGAEIKIKNQGVEIITINLDNANLEYLKQTICPQGLIPDDFPMKIVMMNQLIEDLEDIIDVNDTGFELAKVYYNRDKKKGLEADMIYFETKEVE